MTEQGPQQESQQSDVDTCVACGRPVQFYEAIGDGPGWWDHASSADANRPHRVVLAVDERPATVDATSGGDEQSVGCDCTELCEMGPTCPGGMLARLPGSGCWRSDVHGEAVRARLAEAAAEQIVRAEAAEAEVARLRGIVKAWQWKGWSEVLVPLPQGPMGPANAVLAWIRDFVEAES